MAQFSYAEWQAQQAARKPSNAAKEDRPKVHFINEFIKGDGDVVVVRFPYTSKDDIMYETTHLVQFPGDKYKKRVRCSGKDCPLCADNVKVDVRVFVKAIAYVADDNGKIQLLPAIWDRPAAFAGIDLANLMEEYGDLSQCLFKIKRNGQKLDTRYTISYVANKVVYNPEVYKPDFSVLDGIDAEKVLSRPMESYVKAMNDTSADTDNTPVGTPEDTTTDTVDTSDVDSVDNSVSTPAPTVAANTASSTTESAGPKRYKF